MRIFVLDNSVAMRWCFENATNAYAESVLETLASGQAIAPILWLYEVSAVLAKAQKDGILSGSKADAFLAVLRSLNITVDHEGTGRILTDVHRVAVTYRPTSYDAAYMELAMRRKLPLATLDAELIRALQSAGESLL